LAITLNYSRPIFIGRFQYRSRGGITSFVLVSASDIIISSYLATHRSFPKFLLLFPVVFSACAVFMATAITLDYQQSFSIEAAGITSGRKFIPWSQIVRFGACVTTPGVANSLMLFYTTQPYPRGFHRLPSNWISRDVYEAMIDRLKKEIGDQYPNLTVGGYEAMPGSG
jgi:hypothetical protein